MALAQQFEVMRFTNSELDPILSEIARLFEVGFYYAAIAIALSVPDICSSLENRVGDERRRQVERRYKEWCRDYLQSKFKVFTAQDCWALRGGVLHNGKLHGHTQLGYDRVLFVPPTPITRHEAIERYDNADPKGVLNLDLRRFLNDMIKGATEWHSAKGADKIVRENISGLLRLRSEGFSGSAIGTAVVA